MGLLYQKTSFAVNIFTTVHRNFICYFNIIFLHHKVSFCYYRYLTLTVILLKVPLCEYIYITQVPLFFAFTLPELLTVAIDEFDDSKQIPRCLFTFSFFVSGSCSASILKIFPLFSLTFFLLSFTFL